MAFFTALNTLRITSVLVKPVVIFIFIIFDLQKAAHNVYNLYSCHTVTIISAINLSIISKGFLPPLGSLLYFL